MNSQQASLEGKAQAVLRPLQLQRWASSGVMQMNPVALIDTYCQVWCEPNEERRAELLREVWSDSATYTDPTVHTQGATELLAHITKVLARRPGSRVIRTSKVDIHHGIARFGWRAVEANGNELPEGIDIAFISVDGARIERVVGFFGPLKRNAA